MHLAAESGNVECLRWSTASTTTNLSGVVDNEGRNSLHFASKVPNQQVMEQLLTDANGALYVNTIVVYGQSPFHISLFDEAQPRRFNRALPDTF